MSGIQEDVERMVQVTDETYGRIDFLVNNAAGNFIVPFEKLTPNDWNRNRHRIEWNV